MEGDKAMARGRHRFLRLERDFKDQERLNPKEESQEKWQVHGRRQANTQGPEEQDGREHG